MKARKWILTIVLVLILIMPVSPVSAAPSASITITPPLPNPVPVHAEVSFAIVISVADITPGVSGADIYLGYDNIVEPLTSPNSAVVPLPDFFGPSNITWYEILNPCPVPTGERTSPACIHLVAAGPAQETHSGAVARFYYRVNEGKKACFQVLDSTLANKDGFPVSHTRPAEPQCVNPNTPVSVTVTGTVFRQGTPTNPNPGGGTLACSAVNSVFTDQSGKFEIKLINPPSGAYPIHAEYLGYLASATTINIPSNLPPGNTTINTGPTTLCGGDINADNKINILDIGAIIGKFGSTGVPVRSDLEQGCTDPDEPTDINDDGVVNISDLAIAAGNWTHTGPKPWRTDQCDP